MCVCVCLFICIVIHPFLSFAADSLLQRLILLDGFLDKSLERALQNQGHQPSTKYSHISSPTQFYDFSFTPRRQSLAPEGRGSFSDVLNKDLVPAGHNTTDLDLDNVSFNEDFPPEDLENLLNDVKRKNQSPLRTRSSSELQDASVA